MRENAVIPEEEVALQRRYMDRVREKNQGRGLKYHIVTLGCQMNVRDSETIAGMLTQMGYEAAPSREEADLILYNTCCVRENAENKALGNVIWLKELKKVKPELLICVGGCMMQEEGMGERIVNQYPFIDLVFGTHNLYRLPELLCRVIEEKHPTVEILNVEGGICEGLPEKRGNSFSAYVTVMYGCNNFCSYCIVPYVRGRERSRAVSDILDEAKRLRDQGVKEITLLGQNVNSYGGGGSAFAELLYQLDQLDIPRIRFMTSHPKDLSDELIGCYAGLKHLCGQLHLPVQAGNDQVLEAMNRKYTRERYLNLVDKLRAVRPDIGLTTDIIVGFPGETEAQFMDTVSLIERVRYDSAYTFIYSPRPGTRAAQMDDPVPAEEKSRRIQLLIDRQQGITGEILEDQLDKVEQVLVEDLSSRNEGQVCGKTGRGHMVNFPGGAELIGGIYPVRLISAGRNTLRGEMV